MALRRKSTLPTEEVLADIRHAQESRAKATEQYRKTLLRGFDISQLVSTLAARREVNGFGDAIQITFTPRSKSNA